MKESMFVITFRPLASDVPSAQRVKRLLKIALRCLGLRCMDVKEIKPPATPPVATPAMPGNAKAGGKS